MGITAIIRTPVTSGLLSPNFPNRESSWNISGRELSVRALAHGMDDCLDCVKAIPQSIFNFFCHRYADFRMFFRALSSMGNGTYSQTIENRIIAIHRFSNQVERSNSHRELLVVQQTFNHLDASVQNLFFYTDTDYVQSLAHGNNTVGETDEMRAEIIRECDRAISYQRTLTAVNTFYNVFSGNLFTPATTETPGTTADTRRGGHTTQVPGITRRPPASTAAASGVDLNIPGCVPYVQGAIPAAVQLKADQIIALKTRYDAMVNPPAIPDLFECPALLDVMSIPVFDASHPAVQNALRAANSTGATTALQDRAARHLLNHDSFEGNMNRRDANGNLTTPNCPNCRHPSGRRGTLRENILIDTAFQDQILNWFTTNVAP